jgi:hypothetical protein
VASGQYRALESELPPGSRFFPKPYPHHELIATMRAFAHAA